MVIAARSKGLRSPHERRRRGLVGAVCTQLCGSTDLLVLTAEDNNFTFQDSPDSRAGYQPTDVTPALEMVKPRPEVTVQMVPVTSDRQLKGPIPAVWP